MRSRMDGQLAIDAMAMAVGRRRPVRDLRYHSDQGCRYASRSYQQLLNEHGIQSSMSRKGKRYDNACVESFFSSFDLLPITRSTRFEGFPCIFIEGRAENEAQALYARTDHQHP